MQPSPNLITGPVWDKKVVLPSTHRAVGRCQIYLFLLPWKPIKQFGLITKIARSRNSWQTVRPGPGNLSPTWAGVDPKLPQLSIYIRWLSALFGPTKASHQSTACPQTLNHWLQTPAGRAKKMWCRPDDARRRWHRPWVRWPMSALTWAWACRHQAVLRWCPIADFGTSIIECTLISDDKLRLPEPFPEPIVDSDGWFGSGGYGGSWENTVATPFSNPFLEHLVGRQSWRGN
jgi:hypothetical protein